ncbi:hypothetical protein W03_16040 [Nitrosomonas sp. PY1]|uniref:hypothetical protein n=1 Tax=Nitrosomonas sp. PY1 TaxID=1803906 RepID=UPI001FC88184|nr:hypothetical protein [Nitrosomonas sp. PY1]GKS69600.1 hypothetical protein W03_16040 [Nitrosomonas sp. PY1]
MTPRTPLPIDGSLQTEYYHLQKTIEDFDGRILIIKAWSVTFGLASLVGAFASKGQLVFLFASAGALMFWLLEALWKSFQIGYYERLKQIESHFRSETELEFAHQISTTWQQWWESQTWWVLARVGIWVHVALPHLFVVAAGLACYFTVTFPSAK